MESCLTTEQEALQSKIVYYRCGWFLFMVMVFAPAWLFASSVEGVPFEMAVDIIRQELGYLFFPDFLSSVLSYPVTALATLIPGSSAFIIMPIYMWVGGFSVVVAMLYFAFVQPPYFKELLFKLDPMWQVKENAKWVIKSKAQPIPFSKMIALILLTALVGEIIYGYNRPVIADNYEGSVYLVNRKGQKIPLAVTLKLDLLSPGVVFDKKPGVDSRSLHIRFDGNDVAVLKKLGIDEKLIGENVDKNGYGSVVCGADGTREFNVAGYAPGYRLLVSEHYINKPIFQKNVKCPLNMFFGLESFDEGQFAISDISPDYLIVADVTRNSRFSPLQRWIMKYRYSKDSYRFFKSE
jgi:hypothetical protein